MHVGGYDRQAVASGVGHAGHNGVLGAHVARQIHDANATGVQGLRTPQGTQSIVAGTIVQKHVFKSDFKREIGLVCHQLANSHRDIVLVEVAWDDD